MTAHLPALVEVPFYGDQIVAIRDADGRPQAAIKRICENIGLDYSSQLSKLKSRSWATVGLCPTVAEDGKIRELAVIPIGRIPMWLATVNENRVSGDLREKLVHYQNEAADVLARHFMGADPVPASSVEPMIALLARAVNDLTVRLQALEKHAGIASLAGTTKTTRINRRRGPAPVKLRACMAWLSSRLGLEPSLVSQVRADAEAAGFSASTVYDAVRKLDVVETESAGRFGRTRKQWSLPPALPQPWVRI